MPTDERPADGARRVPPPYDPELACCAGAGTVDGHPLRPGDIPRLRQLGALWQPLPDELRRGGAVWPEVRTVPGLPGAPEVDVVVLWPTRPYDGPRPAVLACHGGGLVTGNAYSGTPMLASWVERWGCVAVSVDYRLAPETPYPGPLDDVLAALAWLHGGADELGIDPRRLGIFGVSAGANLAASACLRARDEGLPAPAFQILQDAMLDDRMTRPSTWEHPDSGPWDRISNTTAWESYLPGRVGAPDVPPYASPARAADHPEGLADLPPAFLDVGTADMFRDDVIAYAAALAQAGVPTELHLWPGGWHGFSEMAPHTRLGRLANATRDDFIARHIGR